MARKPTIRVSILGDANDLMRALDAAERRSQTFGQKMSAIGSTLTRSITLPLIGIGTAAVKAAVEQEKATAKLTSTFNSMGAATWTSVEALEEQAAQFQANSTFGDELIMTGQSILLTFGNLRNEVGEGNQIFDRTTQIMLDLSAALDQDLKSSAVQLGKALNDPIQGVSALQRVGVSFTEQQKEQIRTLQESGKLLEAQKVILSELEKQFGGTAKAISETAGGQMAQAMNDLGDALEVIGAEVLPVLADVAEEVGEVARAFGELPDPAQSAIVKLGIVGLVAGPVAKAVGGLASALGALRSAWLGLGTLGALGGMSVWQVLGGVVQGLAKNIGLLPAIKELYPQSWKNDLMDITGLFEDASFEANEMRRNLNLKPVLKETASALSDGSFELAEHNRHMRIFEEATRHATTAIGGWSESLNLAGDALENNYNKFFTFNGILWDIASNAQEAISQIRQAAQIAQEVADWEEPTVPSRRNDPVSRPEDMTTLERLQERRRREFVDAGGQ